MAAKQKIVLFDIDNTLFSGDLYRERIFSALANAMGQKNTKQFSSLASEEYFDMRKTGPFIPKEFIGRLQKRLGHTFSLQWESILYDESLMREALFHETEDVLKELSNKNIVLGIFSSGPYELQRAKIRAIEGLFHSDHLNIFLFKEQSLPELFKKYEQYDVYFVDDLLEVLYTAKKMRESIHTIWIKRGWVAKQQKPIENFMPDKTITNLEEIIPLFL